MKTRFLSQNSKLNGIGYQVMLLSQKSPNSFKIDFIIIERTIYLFFFLLICKHTIMVNKIE
uniref:Uncharacterized protein n=1 Tax=Octopus bimaculoides TaxID=37653 RepID=A0A0L8G0X9_OCTBM